MAESKYIVGEINCSGLEVVVAVVFPKYVPHVNFKDIFVPGTIRSAGFFTVMGEKIFPFGESRGLGVSSDGSDDKLIGKAIVHPNYNF